jgi:hypothetical protein
MRVKSFAIALTAALPLLTLAACKPHEEQAETQAQTDQAPAPEATPGEIAGTNNNNPNDISATKAQSWIDDVTVGKKVAADGSIAAGDETDDFAPGDPIYVTMKVGDAPAGSQVKVLWYGPGDAKLGEESKDVAAGATMLSFEQTKTASWAKGDYRVEVWAGDEKVNDQHINIVDKAKAG